MKFFWIITVSNPYCDYLLRGLKTMELRRRLPDIVEGDIIFVCRKGYGTEIVGAFKLEQIICRTVDFFCQPYIRTKHRVCAEEVIKYAHQSPALYGLILSRIRFGECIKVEDFGYTRNPQNFYRIKVDFWHKIPPMFFEREKENNANEE